MPTRTIRKKVIAGIATFNVLSYDINAASYNKGEDNPGR
jgi:hypothetical protein